MLKHKHKVTIVKNIYIEIYVTYKSKRKKKHTVINK